VTLKAAAPLLKSFVDEVADMVREILAGSLDIPSDIPGLERRKELDGEIVEALCPMGCGAKARRFSGKAIRLASRKDGRPF
jgi:hypothetical protein